MKRRFELVGLFEDLRSGARVLDAPAGSWGVAERLLASGLRVVGADIAPGNLRADGAPRVGADLFGFRRWKGRPQPELGTTGGGRHINLRNYFDLRAQLHGAGFRIRAARTDKISRTAFLLAPLVPFMALGSALSWRRARDPAQRERNREIRRHVYPVPMRFGKRLILVADRVGEPPS